MQIPLLRDMRREGRPVYGQIADHIRREVEAGRIEPGDRLPPIRSLAEKLGVNRDTVSLAYENLANEGVVESTVGRGTFVRTALSRRNGHATAFAPPLTPVVERLLDFERARPEYDPASGAVPLHSLVPDPATYPLDAFRRTLNRVMTRDGADLLLYGPPQGHRGLREVLSNRFGAMGIDAGVDEIVLCQGASQGIALAMRLFAAPGDCVAVEEPTYHNVLAAMSGQGIHAAPVPMSGEGVDLDVLERTLKRPEVKAFYTIPTFHNPLGTSTRLEHRKALLDIAERCAKPVVEDAYEMDLRYLGRPVPSLAALDATGLVVQLFSFSKALFPGARVGSILARGRSVDALLALKHATDLGGPLALQAALADFVSNGDYDRHLVKLRKLLLVRRAAMLEALEREMPAGSRWSSPEGGYQVWVDLPEPLDSSALMAPAARAGVLFAPGYQFHHDGRPSGGLRLTMSMADEPAIRRGIAALGRAVRDALANGQYKSPPASVQV